MRKTSDKPKSREGYKHPALDLKTVKVIENKERLEKQSQTRGDQGGNGVWGNVVYPGWNLGERKEDIGEKEKKKKNTEIQAESEV